ETADGGTLFLDEIGNLSPAGQMKLLRVLQSGEFERLGSSASRKGDGRIVSAANADRGRAIAPGTLPRGMYVPLKRIELDRPPLGERPDDVLPLADHFLRERSGGAASFSAEARAALLAHDWPGNVRELENRIHRATLVGKEGVIRPEDLGLGARATASV